MGVNPDQRMSEDAHKLCEISTDLSVGLFRSSVLLVSFAGVLWTISEGLQVPRRRRRLRRAGFHAVGRHFICRGGLAA